jgi:hypothetical protein
MRNQNVPFVEVKGTRQDRQELASAAVKEMLDEDIHRSK